MLLFIIIFNNFFNYETITGSEIINHKVKKESYEPSKVSVAKIILF